MKFKVHRLIGVVIFAYIVFKVNCLQVAELLFNSDFQWLFFAFSISIPHIFLKSIRWKYILKIQGYDLAMKDSFLYYLSGIYIGMITPGRLGEFSKAKYLHQSGIVKTISSSLPSVIIDRLFDLYVLFVFSMVGIICFDLEQAPAWLGWGGLVFCLFLSILFCSKKFTLWFFAFVLRKLLSFISSKQLRDNIDRFKTDFLILMSFKLIPAGILTLLSYVLFFFQCTLIAFSISMPVTYIEISSGMAMANFVSMFPITIAGLGTRESVLCFFLWPIGVTTDAVMAYSIGVLIVFYFGGALLGLIAWWLKPIHFGTEPGNK